jgi:hypothetical protein
MFDEARKDTHCEDVCCTMGIGSHVFSGQTTMRNFEMLHSGPPSANFAAGRLADENLQMSLEGAGESSDSVRSRIVAFIYLAAIGAASVAWLGFLSWAVWALIGF